MAYVENAVEKDPVPEPIKEPENSDTNLEEEV
jgi:hypothetical protein